METRSREWTPSRVAYENRRRTEAQVKAILTIIIAIVAMLCAFNSYATAEYERVMAETARWVQ